MGRRRYTDEQFLRAVDDEEVRTLSDLCRRLGIFPGGGNYESLRDHARRLGIEPDERFPRSHNGGRSLAEVDRRTLQRALDEHPTRTAALRSLGLPMTGAAYDWLRRRAADGSLRVPEVDRGAGNRGRSFPERRRASLERKLVRGRRTGTNDLKRQLIDLDLKEHRCEMCGRSRWNGRAIPLELDHVNGDRTDNRLENLRLLCPNCHAQTPTYRGRNIGNGV